MSTSRSAARAVGILFLVSYVSVSIGAVLMAPALDPETPLADLHSDKSRIVLGPWPTSSTTQRSSASQP